MADTTPITGPSPRTDDALRLAGEVTACAQSVVAGTLDEAGGEECVLDAQARYIQAQPDSGKRDGFVRHLATQAERQDYNFTPAKFFADFSDYVAPNPFYLQNDFLTAPVETTALPQFAESRDKLPQPQWQGHDDTIECYWKAWELAFGNLKSPQDGSGFVSNFIDPAFSGEIFMWDTAFMTMFGRYGAKAFDFQGSLDNFYSHQHPNGYISRQIRRDDGSEIFSEWDPSSSGPNIMPWAEWESYQNTGDKERLDKVFAPLVAYWQWFERYRTWQDGTYFSSGWGSGMDNQPRLPVDQNFDAQLDNGQMSWVDTTLQAIFAGKTILKMAAVLGRSEEIADIQSDVDRLTAVVNKTMWDPRTAYYYDRFQNGDLNGVKSIGAYWALLADTVPSRRLPRFVKHLENESEFNRPDPIPTLSADDPHYDAQGGYWLGAVWPSTNYMVLRGLTQVGEDKLAHELAQKHVSAVTEVYNKDHTIFENYAPESSERGLMPVNPQDPNAPRDEVRSDFVGWGGLSPISMLFEYVFGLRPNVPDNTLVWDVRLTDDFGVDQYPFGKDGLVDLHCAARASLDDEPQITVHSDVSFTLILKWDGGQKILQVKPQE